MKKKKKSVKSSKDQKKWSAPKLVIVADNSYEKMPIIYAQYGGGGTGTHEPGDTGGTGGSVITECN